MPNPNDKLIMENIIPINIEIIAIIIIPINKLTQFFLNSTNIVLKLNASFKLSVLANLQSPMISNIAKTKDKIKEIINVRIKFKGIGAVSSIGSICTVPFNTVVFMNVNVCKSILYCIGC